MPQVGTVHLLLRELGGALFIVFFGNQGEALLLWKRSLNGSLEALYDWDPTSVSPCGWFGISCSPDGQVEGLVLQEIDLLGAVPTNLSSLSSSLNRLVLTGTNLTGSIPREIGVLAELNCLDLSDNALSGLIPAELCALPKLEQLYLNSNHLEIDPSPNREPNKTMTTA
ncbi:hypothetical protein CDL15_Pgr007683 [Punica granatum]|uniref:Leucine-rich repeat-containing N-terminal plant-type domain-containing protein n=1 Tax=Punica granatum TaxID=22663 RepID=A0A218X8U8_PUNGR|nr:hypothetical protein CDL15_Pgr007683 [Punica granatum]